MTHHYHTLCSSHMCQQTIQVKSSSNSFNLIQSDKQEFNVDKVILRALLSVTTYLSLFVFILLRVASLLNDLFWGKILDCGL